MVWRLVVAVLCVAGLAVAQGNRCASECVPLQQCPALICLLDQPTRENIRALRDATCFVRRQVPMVCCPTPTETSTPNPVPRPDLLPRACGQSGGLNRIIGGEVAPLDAYPWKAALGYTSPGSSSLEFLCGGSLINERYVLTAAHCVDAGTVKGKTLRTIRLGDWDLSSAQDCEVTHNGDRYCAPPPQDFTAAEVTQHRNYNTRTRFSDDIALIRLDRPVDYTLAEGFISPVCLPPASLAPRTVASASGAVAAGWGFTEQGLPSSRIKHVTLPFVENSQCSVTYGGTIVEEQLCMGGVAGEDSCGGDSGGPLVVSGPRGPPFLQVGIVSYGPVACGQKGIPGVYTSVSHYRNWIELNIKP